MTKTMVSIAPKMTKMTTTFIVVIRLTFLKMRSIKDFIMICSCFTKVLRAKNRWETLRNLTWWFVGGIMYGEMTDHHYIYFFISVTARILDCFFFEILRTECGRKLEKKLFQMVLSRFLCVNSFRNEDLMNIFCEIAFHSSSLGTSCQKSQFFAKCGSANKIHFPGLIQ